MTKSCSKLKRMFVVKLGLLLGMRVLGEVSEWLIEPVSKYGIKSSLSHKYLRFKCLAIVKYLI